MVRARLRKTDQEKYITLYVSQPQVVVAAFKCKTTT